MNEFISNNYFKSTNRHSNYLHQLLNKQNRMEILSSHEKQSNKWVDTEDFDSPETITFKSIGSMTPTTPSKPFSHSIESILSNTDENDFKLSAKKRKTVVDVTQMFYQSTNKKTKTP